MQFSDIDNGKTFDWGNTSKDYAKYRDIYPEEFYRSILDLGLCRDGQKVLDIGTGTGVLPRNMYPAEEVDYPDDTFDVITVCQCIWYLDPKAITGKFARMLKPGGKLLILYMGWLPYEDAIAGKSEEIILKHNPNWSSYGDTVHPVYVFIRFMFRKNCLRTLTWYCKRSSGWTLHLQEKAGMDVCAPAGEWEQPWMRRSCRHGMRNICRC